MVSMARRAILLSVLVSIQAFSQQPDRQQRLEAGTALLLTLEGAEVATFDVAASGLEVVVDPRQGMAGVLVALAADGAELSSADLARRSPVARRLLVPAGAVRVQLRPANHGTLRR